MGAMGPGVVMPMMPGGVGPGPAMGMPGGLPTGRVGFGGGSVTAPGIAKSIGALGGAGYADSPWMSAETMPGSTLQLPLTNGSLIEVITYDDAGRADGTSLFLIDSVRGDMGGYMLEASHKGSSVIHKGVQLDQLFTPLSGVNAGVLHICSCPRGHCSFAWPGRTVLHADTARVRDASKVSEVWARGLEVGSGSSSFTAGGTAASEEEVLQDKIKRLKKKLNDHRLSSGKGGVGDKLAHAAAKAAKQSRRKRKRDRSESEDSHSSLFELAPPGQKEADPNLVGQEFPGELYARATQELTKWCGSRGGTSSDQAGRWVQYLTAVFHGAHPINTVGLRTSRELRTLAEALDAIGTGDLPRLADLLTQRFKAIETYVQDGTWQIAKHQELIPAIEGGLSTVKERREAAKQETRELRLVESRDRSSRRRSRSRSMDSARS